MEYYRFASALSGVRHGERDLSDLDPETIAARRRIEVLQARIAAIEAPARASSWPSVVKPRCRLRPGGGVDFQQGLSDKIGSLKATLRGNATLTAEGLHLDGKTGYAVSSPLPRDLGAKTIEAWVRLDNLNQRGGAAISIQTSDGGALMRSYSANAKTRSGWQGVNSFSAIAAREAARKLRRRSARYMSQSPTPATARFGCSAMAGHTENRQDVRPVGVSRGQYRGRLRFADAGGGNRMLGGPCPGNDLRPGATKAEVAASAAAFGDHLDPAAIAALLSLECRAERSWLFTEIERIRSSTAHRSRKSYAVSPREAGATRVQIRGNPNQAGEVVAAGAVAAVVAPGVEFGLAADAPESVRRKALASWIASSRNPLFARRRQPALASTLRIGVDETSSDLGFNGGAPSHPELLDWLASEMVARGFSLKSMRRLIVCSSTYRQASTFEPSAHQRDAGARLLWRKLPRDWKPRWCAMRCSRSRGSSTTSWVDRVSATRRSFRPLARPRCCTRRSTQNAGTQSADSFPCLGSRRPKCVSERVRLPRSLDHHATPPGNNYPPPGPLTDEQCISALSLRCLCCTVSRERGPDAGKQVERAYRLALRRS